MFPVFDIAGSALTTHRIWMNALADNIANINTVKPMSKAAYQEKFIVAQEIPSSPDQPVGVAPVKVEYGDATGMVTFDPTNPLADKHGLVRRPSENLGDQMTNLIIAQRGYQLNLAVIDRAKNSYQQALDINGR